MKYWGTRLSKTSKTTILFLSWRDIKSPKKGGAEVYTHEMLKRIDFNKYRVIHISPMFEDGKNEEIIDNIIYLRRGGFLSVIGKAKKYYKKNKENIDYVVDQCNTHRFFTKFWVEQEKRIFFIHQLTREIWFINMRFPFNIIGYITEVPFLRLSKRDATITVSNSTKQDLIDIGFEENKVRILPEGIEFNHWKRAEFLKKEAVLTYIYVGRFANYKGIDATIQAFAQVKRNHKDAKLWIVGKKNDQYIKEKLTPIFNENNISFGNENQNNDVTFFGFVSDEKKLELMSKSHALIFPSIREGWGLIVTEAAAVGTPSIVYNSPGIVDAVDYGKAGYLCEDNTVDNIVKLMKRVVERPNEYEAFREAAYKYSLNFHWDNTGEHFDIFISEKIAGEEFSIGI